MFIEDIVNDVSEKYKNVFGSLFVDRAIVFMNNLYKKICFLIKNKIDIDQTKIMYSICDVMYRNYIQLSIRSLINNMILTKSNLYGDTSEERYRYYVSLIKNKCFIANKKLDKILLKKEQQLKTYIYYSLRNLCRDKQFIERTFNVKIKKITNINMEYGDTHNNGQSVIVFSFNDDFKLVYKPHNLYNDIILSRVYEWFNNYDDIKYKIKHLKVLNKVNYGWQEYIVEEKNKNIESILRYLYRMGVIIFITYLLDFTDLHHENIITNNEFPILVDSETMFSNRSSFNNYIWERASLFDRVLSKSVFSTMILPIVIRNNGFNNFRVVNEGFVEKYEVKTDTLINCGTDEMCFRKVKNYMIYSKFNDFFSNLDFSKYQYQSLIDRIIQGFKESYNLFLREKDNFLECIKSFDFDNGVYRQIFRNTSSYQKYLDAYSHPYYLNNQSMVERLFNSLKGNIGYVSLEHRILTHCEKLQLTNLDIPYFVAHYNSNDLFTSNGLRIKKFYKYTIAEQFFDKIKNLSQRDLYMQEYFIRCSFWNVKFNTNSSKFKFFMNNYDFNSIGLIDYIYDFRKRYHQIDNNKPIYYNWSLDDSRKVEIEPFDLYSGIGSLLFEFQYNLKKFGKYELKMLNEICDINSALYNEYNISFKYLGVFNGLVSILYLNVYLYSYIKNDLYIRNSKKIIEKIIIDFDDFCISYDVISGLSGIIILCFNILKKGYIVNHIKELMKCCLNKLYEAYTLGLIEIQTGFAHGYAGISTAFILGSKVFSNNKFYDVGMELIQNENEFYDKTVNNWKILDSNIHMSAWCYGTAGILVSRNIIMSEVKEIDKNNVLRDINRCVNNLLQYLKNNKDSMILCHGIFGILEVLLWYTNSKNDLYLGEEVKKITEKIVCDMLHNGIKYEYDMKNINISFMNGISGMAYYLLRTLYDDIPSVLALEI